jgi:penicillin-binding protein 1C
MPKKKKTSTEQPPQASANGHHDESSLGDAAPATPRRKPKSKAKDQALATEPLPVASVLTTQPITEQDAPAAESTEPVAKPAEVTIPNTNGHENGAAPEPVGPIKVKVVDTNGHAAPAPNGTNGTNGNGVKPVKVRLSEGFVDTTRLEASALTGKLNGNGHNGHNGNGKTGRLTSTLAQNTATLRDTDLLDLRLRLKREEWSRARAGTRRTHGRPLPFFLMRHRNWRSRSRVGHTRSTAATRRYGNGGPAKIVALLLVVSIFMSTLLAGASVGGAVAGGLWYINTKLPPVTPEFIHTMDVQTTKIYDRKGRALFDIVDEGTGRRHEVKLDQISPLVISATVAVEDAGFYTNIGVEPVAIARAIKINLGDEGSSGGSTITQQLVRRVNLPEKDEQSLSRKVREAIQAVRFTQMYSKDEILEMYLNDIPYGHRAYGIEAAALTYFNKPASELSLAEAAMLAGLPQAPSQLDPFVNPDLARARQAIVLDLMAKQKMITQDEADNAKTEVITQDAAQAGLPKTLVLKTWNPPLTAPHFVYYVKDYLERMYGPEADTAGFIVTTTLDLDVQAAAEKVARDRIEELQRQRATNASIVIMKPGTGEILAMVGSVDYNNKAIDGQVNVATRERQPGSSFKPITYVTAFKKGWTPGTTLLDVYSAFPNGDQKPYTPKNYDGRDHGWVTVRESLGNSYNIPAVKALQYAGIQDVIDTAHDMGIHGLNRGLGWYGLSLTLGGGEVTLLDMTNAYSTFANNGVEVDANPILKIEDPQGRIINCNEAYVTQGGSCSSKQQKQFAAGNGQVLDPRNAFMITSILSDNRARSSAFGPNSVLRVSFPAAVKTGTTDDNRDSWTMGYTPNLTVGVWVGNSNNAQMLKVTGAIGAAVVWHNMMESFYSHKEFLDLVRDPADGKLHQNFTQPPGLVKNSACSAKGEVYDLFLKDSPPKGCVTYKDKNKQLHSLPSDKPAEKKPEAKPTPLPGIWPPLQP